MISLGSGYQRPLALRLRHDMIWHGMAWHRITSHHITWRDTWHTNGTYDKRHNIYDTRHDMIYVQYIMVTVFAFSFVTGWFYPILRVIFSHSVWVIFVKFSYSSTFFGSLWLWNYYLVVNVGKILFSILTILTLFQGPGLMISACNL